MKLLLMVLLSFSAFGAPVDGELFYKLPNGKTAIRKATIEVPSRGQGEVHLFGEGFNWFSKDFKSYSIKGKTSFVVSFKVKWQDKESKVILHGTYFKTKDLIKYYGDMYQVKNLDGNYIGGFEFNYQR